MEVDGITTYLRRLRSFVEVPGYRLEPRLDALIAPYLAALIGIDPSTSELTPEFPVPRSIAKSGEGKALNKGVHVDFLLIDRSHSWHLVELKVADSMDPAQVGYLQALATVLPAQFVEGLQMMRKATRSPNRKRYERLIEQISNRVSSRLPAVHFVAPRPVLEKMRDADRLIAHDLASLAAVIRRADDPWSIELALLLEERNSLQG